MDDEAPAVDQQTIVVVIGPSDSNKVLVIHSVVQLPFPIRRRRHQNLSR